MLSDTAFKITMLKENKGKFENLAYYKKGGKWKVHNWKIEYIFHSRLHSELEDKSCPE